MNTNLQARQPGRAESSRLEYPNSGQSSSPQPPTADAVSPKPIRTLVLKDIAQLAKPACERLVVQGFEMEVTHEGGTAIWLLGSHAFHLALVDIDLFDVSEFEAVAQGQSDRVVTTTEGEFAKYIVLTFQGREQVTVFSFSRSHSEVLRAALRECPDTQAISAGFFMADGNSIWCSGGSESLGLAGRPEDQQALEAFLRSPDQSWNLLHLSAEDQKAARQEMAEAGWC